MNTNSVTVSIPVYRVQQPYEPLLPPALTLTFLGLMVVAGAIFLALRGRKRK